jgi:hypothetical protein
VPARDWGRPVLQRASIALLGGLAVVLQDVLAQSAGGARRLVRTQRLGREGRPTPLAVRGGLALLRLLAYAVAEVAVLRATGVLSLPAVQEVGDTLGAMMRASAHEFD